jgi:hypothetical protein
MGELDTTTLEQERNRVFMLSSSRIGYVVRMLLRSVTLCIALLGLAGPSLASSMRELDGADLRRVVREEGMISLKEVIQSLSRQTGGEPVEARAFQDESVFYRIVLKMVDGSVISIIIDAKTGEQVPKGSAIGKDVAAAVKSGASSKGGKSDAAKSKTAGNGNGNSGGGNGGNGNGGSGGGNGGGKGGANGGGNGKN